jgi:hypothetical protein
VLAPGNGAAGFVVLLHGEVDQEGVGGCAVPVVLAGLEVDAVAGSDDLGGTTLALAQADTFRDEDRLPVWVGVPGGPRARVKWTRAAAKVELPAGAATASI